ncbi:alpha/beta hydrolase [Oceanobacillus sp. CAU 1775]
MNRKQAIKIFMFFGIFIFVVGCSTDDPIATTEEAAHEVIDSLVAGEYEVVYGDWFEDELQTTLPLSELEDTWERHKEVVGEFQGTDTLEISRRGDNLEVVEGYLNFTNTNVKIRMIFNEDQRLVGLHLSDAEVNFPMPDSIMEEEILVGEGTEYELEGVMTLPKENQENLPAVVLVHGSGPSDRDESVFSYKAFRDIAWGLAEQGIASIRYDKRTFIYGEKMSRASNDLTVYEETIEDTIIATELLKEDARIDDENVFIIGHSLGGMLAPRIDLQGGNYAGLIILAGTPRPLWEVVYDQNLQAIEAFVRDESEKERQLAFVEAEVEKARQLQGITDEEAKEMTVFGIDGYYLKEMDEYPVETLLSEIDKPIFILQGEDDFQVYFEKDYLLWEELLLDHEQATLRSYPGLNHFFVDYEGPNKGTVGEYEIPAQVEANVIEDIGLWILNQR